MVLMKYGLIYYNLLYASIIMIARRYYTSVPIGRLRSMAKYNGINISCVSNHSKNMKFCRRI
jgi:hypothetical protein